MLLLSVPFLCVERLDDAGGCTGGFELRVFLKETGCREEIWLLRIKGDGDFLGITMRNNMRLAALSGASACRGQVQ